MEVLLILKVIRIVIGSLFILGIILSWFFSYDVPIHLLALVSALMFFDNGVELLKSDRTIRGSVTLLVSSLMAFLFMETFFPIT